MGFKLKSLAKGEDMCVEGPVRPRSGRTAMTCWWWSPFRSCKPAQAIYQGQAFVLIGIFAATLSSAIASLVNPIRGYFLSFGVSFCCNLIGELNAIAPLISQFIMLTYLLKV